MNYIVTDEWLKRLEAQAIKALLAKDDSEIFVLFEIIANGWKRKLT